MDKPLVLFGFLLLAVAGFALQQQEFLASVLLILLGAMIGMTGITFDEKEVNNQ